MLTHLRALLVTLAEALGYLRAWARREPARARAVATWAVGSLVPIIAVRLGVELDPAQVLGLVLGLLGLTAAQGETTRRQVTPVAEQPERFPLTLDELADLIPGLEPETGGDTQDPEKA